MSVIVNERWDDFTRKCSDNTPGGRQYPYGFCYALDDQCDNAKCPRNVFLSGETFNESVARYNNVQRASQLLED